MKLRLLRLLSCLTVCSALGLWAQSPKQPISLDEFFSATSIDSARISPDGQAAVIGTSAADWKNSRYSEDLWLWRERSGKTVPLTRSGHDSDPRWSPDGKTIAFVSTRALPGDDPGTEISRVWVIPVDGGEAVPLYREKLDVHAFAWSVDGSSIDFSVEEPLSQQAEEAQKKEWKDVVRWREQERGDLLLSLPIVSAGEVAGEAQAEVAPTALPLPHAATILAHSKLAIDSIVPAPAGDAIAFTTTPVSLRMEGPEYYEVFLASRTGRAVRQLTHNQGIESDLHWSQDGRRLYFLVGAASGSVEGPYRDVQGRLYSMDVASGKIDRLGADYAGSWEGYTLTSGGALVAEGLSGTERPLFGVQDAKETKLTSRPGTYSGIDAARHATEVLFRRSTLDAPTQVYVAPDAAHLDQAKAVTSFSQIFTKRAAPEWRVFRWKADDGVPVEGVLVYPPGKLGAKHLHMLTLIHGGPAHADGNRFGSGWYEWAGLAAAQGWLVFRPNYRGSSGYGDQFMLQISPHIVSRPGKDILEGVDELVKEGIADPDHLAVGGYSYGGYMTNWLITQTTRFKAAVTGAGAVEHAANWGNDDDTYDDAWYLGGTPWQNPAIYQSEAALFQMNKVTTPTHLVGGQDDIRVSYLEDVLMERALQTLHIPHSFLSFPGEGHELGKDPWHGYIKVREELKWIDKYAGTP